MEKINVKKLEELGRGHDAVVYKYQLPHNGRWVALKVHNKINQEENIGRLEHPFVLPLLDRWEKRNPLTGQTKSFELYPIMDENLKSNINLISPSIFFPIIRQVIEGIEYMHTAKFSHRDLEPQNIFLHLYHEGKFLDQKYWVPKIGDFVYSIKDEKGRFFDVDYKGILSILWYCLETYYLQSVGKSLRDRDQDRFKDDGIVMFQIESPLSNYLPGTLLEYIVSTYKNAFITMESVKTCINIVEEFIMTDSKTFRYD